MQWPPNNCFECNNSISQTTQYCLCNQINCVHCKFRWNNDPDEHHAEVDAGIAQDIQNAQNKQQTLTRKRISA
jgi:hypothetical protein